MQHSSLGASGAKRWLACPASIRLSRGRPDPGVNHFGAEGTVAHAVCEAALRDGKSAKAYIGLYGNGENDIGLYAKPTGHTFEFKVTAEMATACQVYVDAVNDKMTELTLAGHDPILFVEKRFSLDHIQKGMFGTNDASIWVPGVYLGVFDYKHGRGVQVEVEDNPQLNYYAVGALREVGVLVEEYTDIAGVKWVVKADIKPDTVESVIVQPRAGHANGPVRRWETTPDYLLGEFSEKLKAGARATLDPNSQAVAGDHCKWCLAEAICPALQKIANDELQSVFSIDPDELEAPTKSKAKGKQVGSQDAVKRTPESLAKLIPFIPVIEGWAASIMAEAHRLAEAGETIPGYKLVAKQTRRRWANKDTAIEALSLVLDPSQYLKDPELRSFTELERLPMMERLIDALTEKPESDLTLVPETDRRPSAKRSAEASGFEIDAEDMI